MLDQVLAPTLGDFTDDLFLVYLAAETFLYGRYLGAQLPQSSLSIV